MFRPLPFHQYSRGRKYEIKCVQLQTHVFICLPSNLKRTNLEENKISQREREDETSHPLQPTGPQLLHAFSGPIHRLVDQKKINFIDFFSFSHY